MKKQNWIKYIKNINNHRNLNRREYIKNVSGETKKIPEGKQ